jgi:hypothetical protein
MVSLRACTWIHTWCTHDEIEFSYIHIHAAAQYSLSILVSYNFVTQTENILSYTLLPSSEETHWEEPWLIITAYTGKHTHTNIQAWRMHTCIQSVSWSSIATAFLWSHFRTIEGGRAARSRAGPFCNLWLEYLNKLSMTVTQCPWLCLHHSTCLHLHCHRRAYTYACLWFVIDIHICCTVALIL